MDLGGLLEGFGGLFGSEAAEQRRREAEERQLRDQRRARGRSALSAADRAEGGFMVMPAIAGPEDHARILGGMSQNIMSAFARENASRVSQSRELRRMQHEKELKAMEMGAELEALLRRIQAAREGGSAQPRASGPGFAIY